VNIPVLCQRAAMATQAPDITVLPHRESSAEVQSDYRVNALIAAEAVGPPVVPGRKALALA